MNSVSTIRLSLRDTQELKGVALILLLCHHCWYEGKGYTEFYLLGVPVFKQIGVFCKLCVTIFVFLSGYGLTESASNKGALGNVFSFYRKRFGKLMINYWFIYLLFVPVGVFFGRTFAEVYGGNYMIPAFADFIGMHYAIIGHPWGYNPTWWFYSCIILLYLMFPIFWLIRRVWYLFIPMLYILYYLSIFPFYMHVNNIL